MNAEFFVFRHKRLELTLNQVLDYEAVSCLQRPCQDFGSGGGDILVDRPRRLSGGGAARTPENFENFQKIFKKIAKYELF